MKTSKFKPTIRISFSHENGREVKVISKQPEANYLAILHHVGEIVRIKNMSIAKERY